MALFAWDDSYSVHVSQLDAQHKVLFDTINELAGAMRTGHGQQVIRDVVERLAAYTRTHFLREELLMQQCGYPQLAQHRAQHSKLMADVEKYRNDLAEGRNPNTVAVLAFLQSWLVEHIRGSDKAYSDHLNAHGIR
jgi:hemerythrin